MILLPFIEGFSGFEIGRRKLVRKNILAVAFLAFCPLLFAQQALNNDSVIKLVKAGLSEDLIVTTINGSAGNYDTSAEGIIALKTAGVSDKVVAAVVAKAAAFAPVAGPPTPVAPPPVPQSVPALSVVPPEIDSVGMYYKDNSGQWQEVVAEVVNFKTGGALKSIATAGLVKGDMNGHIGGKNSHLVLTFPAEFILYVPEGRSPGEYQLLHLHVNSNNREFRSVTGGIVHVTGGAIRDDMNFVSKKIAPRIYQITLNNEIGKGEFGFLPPLDTISQKNLASSGKIYTFSIIE